MNNPLIFALTLLIAVLAAREVYIFHVLPRAARRLAARGDRAAAIAVWRRVGRARAFFGRSQKLRAHYELGVLSTFEKDYRTAARHFRVVLVALQIAKRKGVAPRLAQKTPGLEASVRRRLADCLEALGLNEESDVQRGRADTVAATAPEGALARFARAKLMEQAGRHAEACDEYQRALDATPAGDTRGRARLLVQLAICSLSAARPHDTARYAQEAVDMNPPEPFYGVALRMAAVGLSSTGRREEAEALDLRALAAARKTGNDEAACSTLGHLSSLHLHFGRMEEAIASGGEAGRYGLASGRVGFLSQASALSVMGDPAAAHAALKSAQALPGFAIPAAERRSQAMLSLALAKVEMELGNLDAAERCLDTASREVGHEALLGLHCTTLLPRLLALKGRHEEAVTALDRAETLVCKEPDENEETRKEMLANLGRAAFAIPDYARSLAYWERLDLMGPDLPTRPRTQYFIGECRRALGDDEGAKAAYEAAAAEPIETEHSRLARERLASL